MKYHIIYDYTNIDGETKRGELVCFTGQLCEERVKWLQRYGCVIVDVVMEKEKDGEY